MDRIHVRFLRFSAFYTPLLLTIGGDHLRAEGLEATWDTVVPGRTIEEGIASGAVHVAQSATAVSFAPWERGERLPFRHFALLNARDGFFLGVRDAQPGAGWEAVAGRTILADHFFQPMAFLRRALQLRGIDERELTIVDAGDPAAIEAAFRAGHGDVVHLQGPGPQAIEEAGIARVAVSVGEAVGPVAFSTLCASPAWLATPQAAAFTRAFARAKDEAVTAPVEEVARRIAPFLPGASTSSLLRTIEDYRRIRTWEGGIEIDRERYDRTVDVFQRSGEIAGEPPYAAIVAAPPAVDTHEVRAAA